MSDYYDTVTAYVTFTLGDASERRPYAWKISRGRGSALALSSRYWPDGEAPGSWDSREFSGPSRWEEATAWVRSFGVFEVGVQP